MAQTSMDNKKKALIVTTVSGFVPQFEMNNVRILQDMGYEVHYASNFNMVSYGTDNHQLDGTGIIRHQVDFERSPYKIRAHYKALAQLSFLLNTYDFTLIHCHTPVGAALARIAAKKYKGNKNVQFPKVIYTAHGFHFYKGAPLRYWLLFYPVERWLANYTDVLITINKEDFERATRFCKKKKTMVEYVPGVGIDTAYFSGQNLESGERQKIREEMRKTLGVKEDEIMLLSVGELIPRKNHIQIIEALAKNKRISKLKGFISLPEHSFDNEDKWNSKYFICGQGILKDKLQMSITNLGLDDKVKLLGYRKDIRNLLYAADVFVFPSKQEGMPVALMEALTIGIPVLVSNIRGNKDSLLLNNKEKSLFDAEEIIQKMKFIYSSVIYENVEDEEMEKNENR